MTTPARFRCVWQVRVGCNGYNMRQLAAFLTFSLLAFAPVAHSSECEMFRDSHLNLPEPQRKRRPPEIEASVFLQALAERVWLTNYFGKPTDALGNWPFCGSALFRKVNKTGGSTLIASQNEIPTRAIELKESVWPYSCRPVEVVLKKETTSNALKIEIHAVQAVGMERMFQQLSRLISGDDKGYWLCLKKASALELQKNLNTRFGHLHSQRDTGQMLSGFWLLDVPEKNQWRQRALDFLRMLRFEHATPGITISNRLVVARYSLQTE